MTDWPGHASFNRHPHKLTSCLCDRWFTADNEPPWVYLWTPIGTQTNANLEYLNRPHYLTPDRSYQGCRWKYSDFGEDLEWTREIFLTVSPGIPNLLNNMVFRIKTYNFFAANIEYEQGSPNIIAPPNRWTRGTVFTAVGPSWVRIDDCPGPDCGPPVGICSVSPMDCIPGWTWGESIPNPPP